MLTSVSDPEFSIRHSKGLCTAPYCRNNARVQGKYTYKFCFKCLHIRSKERNPTSYWYSALKGNARRRGKSFSLTRSEFAQFCEETGYLSLKGTEGNKFSIDRIDQSRGYSFDNIQMITLSENTRKHWIDQKILHGRYLTKEEQDFYASLGHGDKSQEVPSKSEDLPF